MKVPEPKKLPSGNYNIYMRLGGESISITRNTAAACRNEARVIKAEYLAGRRSAANREARELTLKELQENYVNANRAVLSPSTVKGYEQMLRWRWEGSREREVRFVDWQAMVNEELSKVSPKTVKNAWALVAAAMRHAGLTVPQVKLAQCPVKEIDFLQPDEIGAFLKEIKGKRYEVAALLLLHGLRVSEVRGLKWHNVDMKRGLLHVRGAVVEGPDGFTHKDTNKNNSSSRDVPIMIPRLSELLQAGGTGDDYVVPLCSSVILRDVRRATGHAVGREITSHGLRHSWSSLMYELNIPERQVMQWGGWSDIHTMHKVYIRLAAASEARSRQAVQSFFKNANADENADEI